jgi:hypothetical protein
MLPGKNKRCRAWCSWAVENEALDFADKALDFADSALGFADKTLDFADSALDFADSKKLHKKGYKTRKLFSICR